MATPNDPYPNNCEFPTMASSRFKITKEGIESEQRVPGEHTPGLLSTAVITICCVMAVVAPAVTFRVALSDMNAASIVVIVLVQELVILTVAVTARVRRRG